MSHPDLCPYCRAPISPTQRQRINSTARPRWVAQTLGQITTLLERGHIDEAHAVAYSALHAVED